MSRKKLQISWRKISGAHGLTTQEEPRKATISLPGRRAYLGLVSPGAGAVALEAVAVGRAARS